MNIQVNQISAENQGILRDFYKLGKVLGSGAFGEVRIAKHSLTQEQRAIKVINRESMEDAAMFEKEVNILRQCDHPNILKIYEYF